MEKWNLEQLKEKYKTFQIKYDLPSFEKLNEDFQIEKAYESETDFLLREIRKYITDKFFNYLRFIESLINPPSNSPMFAFAIIKTFGEKEKEKLTKLYKKIAKIDIDLIELDLEYYEEKEAKSIKEYFEIWQEIKKELIEIIDVIKKNWDNKTEEEKGKYFG